MPPSREQRVEQKRFYFDVGSNTRGVYLRISEVCRWFTCILGIQLMTSHLFFSCMDPRMRDGYRSIFSNICIRILYLQKKITCKKRCFKFSDTCCFSVNKFRIRNAQTLLELKKFTPENTITINYRWKQLNQ